MEDVKYLKYALICVFVVDASMFMVIKTLKINTGRWLARDYASGPSRRPNE